MTANVDSVSISARAQAARSLVCVFVVLVHVIGNAVNADIQIDNNSLYFFVGDLFAPIRMPLFACLSGFVYAYRPLQPGQWRSFVGKKLLRLGLPLCVATTITFCCLVIIGRQIGMRYGIHDKLDFWSILQVYLYPFQHLWFLQALIGVIATVMVLESLGTLRTLPRWVAVFSLSLLVFFTSPLNGVTIFSIKDISFLLPFFLLGLAANRFHTIVLGSKTMNAVIGIFVVTVTMHAIDISFGRAELDRATPLAALLGLSAVLCILRWMPTMKAFQWLASYSFSIYLYHVVVIMFAALVAAKLEWHSVGGFVLVTLLLSVMLPIVLEAAARKHDAARLLLLGEYRKPKTVSAYQGNIEFA